MSFYENMIANTNLVLSYVPGTVLNLYDHKLISSLQKSYDVGAIGC